jgi:hypothetical protein
MTNTMALPCDGCGQAASTEHIGRRLRRLEWTTRYRPVHIHTLLLGGVSPSEEEGFLYSPQGEIHGEAKLVLEAAGISAENKTREGVHAEFQRAGFFLTHVLECPIDRESAAAPELACLLERQLPLVLTRIRRSLKPKRIVLISGTLGEWTEKIINAQSGSAVLLDEGKPFALESSDAKRIAARLRNAVTAASSS